MRGVVGVFKPPDRNHIAIVADIFPFGSINVKFARSNETFIVAVHLRFGNTAEHITAQLQFGKMFGFYFSKNFFAVFVSQVEVERFP